MDNVKLFGSGSGAGLAGQLAYDTLISVDPVTLKPVMRLAKSLDSSPDARVWTIKLRPQVVFSDGTPLDAAAVVANWDRHKIPALASVCLTIASGLGSYVARDTSTVVITLPEARVAFRNQLAGCLGQIESPTAVAKYGANYGTSPETTVGAGPFLLKEWARGSQMTWARNPTYWDKPRPYLDSMVVKPVNDTNQKFVAFQAGQGDVANFSSTSTQIAGLVESTGAKIFGYPSVGGGADVAFNQKAPGLDDVRIRTALVLATDPEDLNLKAAGGTATLVETYFVKGSPQYNPKVRQVSNNLKQAQKLVDEYVAEKGPVNLSFLLTESLTSWGQAQVQQWNRLNGLTVQLDVVPAPNAQSRLTVGDWQMAVTAHAASDPEALNTLLHSTSRSNVIKYSNPTVDAALTQLRGETDAKKQYALYTTITKEFLDDAAVVYWFRALLPTVIRKGVSGIAPYNGANPDFAQISLAKQ
ncbi:MAG: ABC transporter substrate-binding protein [Acidimicrobiia bacterium]